MPRLSPSALMQRMNHRPFPRKHGMKNEARHLPKVLCVDDEPPLRRSLRWLLRGEFDVVVASDGAQALALLGAQRFDVLLSDQRMPGMCGTELLRQAREASPHTVRLLLAGYADFSSVVSALNEGDVFRCISKPWNDARLIRSVQDAARLSRLTRLAWSDFQDTGADGGAPARHEEVLLVQADAGLARACTQACAAQATPPARLLLAQDMADALTLLAQRRPAVLLLQQAGDPHGALELVRAAKRRTPALSVVLASASHDLNALQQLIDEGLICHYLGLPADGAHLALMLERAIERHLVLRRKPHWLASARRQRRDESRLGLEPQRETAPRRHHRHWLLRWWPGADGD